MQTCQKKALATAASATPTTRQCVQTRSSRQEQSGVGICAFYNAVVVVNHDIGTICK